MNKSEAILINRDGLFISERIIDGVKFYSVVKTIDSRKEDPHYMVLLTVKVIDNNEQKALISAFECFLEHL